MPVRVITASHEANPITAGFADSGLQVLKGTDVEARELNLKVIQSSFEDGKLPSMYASDNGFVRSVITAYNQHHHLVLRPDDIWFAILTQISTYINAHAEELRDKFVEHEGQKKLSVEYTAADRYSVDFGAFAYKMTKLLEKNIIDPEFRDWVMPKFTTTTKHDQVVASVIMMATMGKYFTYECMLACGIPSVTLLGEKADYELILKKLDKLPTLGTQPGQFASVLRPVVRRIIGTFGDPLDALVVDFWKRVVDVQSMSGSTTYSGWITAFCFWNQKGESMHRFSEYDSIENYSDSGPLVRAYGNYTIREKIRLMLDGVRYHKVEDNDVPTGWSKVPVIINDHGEIVNSEMLAGSVGISCSSSMSGVEGQAGVACLDTMQPQTGWWIYEK